VDGLLAPISNTVPTDEGNRATSALSLIAPFKNIFILYNFLKKLHYIFQTSISNCSLFIVSIFLHSFFFSFLFFFFLLLFLSLTPKRATGFRGSSSSYSTMTFSTNLALPATGNVIPTLGSMLV
jgi:hypothetical protein